MDDEPDGLLAGKANLLAAEADSIERNRHNYDDDGDEENYGNSEDDYEVDSLKHNAGKANKIPANKSFQNFSRPPAPVVGNSKAPAVKRNSRARAGADDYDVDADDRSDCSDLTNDSMMGGKAVSRREKGKEGVSKIADHNKENKLNVPIVTNSKSYASRISTGGHQNAAENAGGRISNRTPQKGSGLALPSIVTPNYQSQGKQQPHQPQQPQQAQQQRQAQQTQQQQSQQQVQFHSQLKQQPSHTQQHQQQQSHQQHSAAESGGSPGLGGGSAGSPSKPKGKPIWRKLRPIPISAPYQPVISSN